MQYFFNSAQYIGCGYSLEAYHFYSNEYQQPLFLSRNMKKVMGWDGVGWGGLITPDSWMDGNRKCYYYRQSRSKIVRNRVFDCHLSPNWRQIAIENTVSSHL